MHIQSINPATGELIKEYEIQSVQEVNHSIDQVDASFRAWKSISLEARLQHIESIRYELSENKLEYARMITLEMGKRLSESIAEVTKCELLCQYYIDHSEGFLSNEIISERAQVKMCPLGVVLGVMPWNFPFWQVFRFAIPTLIVGNTVLLKHASNVPGCALLLEKLFKTNRFNAPVFKTLLIKADSVEHVLSSNAVKGVSLTGSEWAGSSVARIAGSQLKPSLLELGGSDPFIIFEDASLKQALEEGVKSRFMNCGQSCIAAKRFIVHESLYDKFLKSLDEKLNEFKSGDPLDDTVDLGPMAREDLAIELEEQVIKAIDQGAQVFGKNRNTIRNGSYFTPQILCNVKKGMDAYDQELFGPVAVVFSFKSIEEAIALANDVPFGLGASVWTDQKNIQEKCIEELEYGGVFFNQMVASNPALPFGGVKKSGFGRELAKEGLRAFANLKTIVQ